MKGVGGEGRDGGGENVRRWAAIESKQRETTMSVGKCKYLFFGYCKMNRKKKSETAVFLPGSKASWMIASRGAMCGGTRSYAYISIHTYL